MIKTIGKNNLEQLWKRLAARGPLYLPLQEGPVTLFKPWYDGAVVNLEAVSSAVSPRDIFMPRDETYLQFSREGQDLELQPAAAPEGPVTAFGFHPCDLRAVELLDKVFLDQEPADDLYRRHRAATTVVALACREADPYCFCATFGINPADAPGADVMAWWEEDNLVLESRTEKGEDLLHDVVDMLEECSTGNKPVPPATTDFGLALEGMPERLKERFDDSAWESLYRACLGCGACTYICPTCHCFDVQDYGCQEQGERFRCWDSCMFGQFTLMAGGHNPRPTRKERVRNRFLHKLQYFPEKYGAFGCVGCGRCLRSCPVQLDIVRAARTLGGETVAQG